MLSSDFHRSSGLFSMSLHVVMFSPGDRSFSLLGSCVSVVSDTAQQCPEHSQLRKSTMTWVWKTFKIG